MFIRRTKTNSTASNEAYLTHRLVRGERIGGKVRQITVLNLGRHFPIKQEDWPLLCCRIEDLLHAQDGLFASGVSDHIERAAQRCVRQLIARAALPEQDAGGITSSPDSGIARSTGCAAPTGTAPDYQERDINSLQQTHPRSVGVEQAGLHVLSQLGLVEKLTELGINGVMRAAILGNLIGRMAEPASELSTWRWLQTRSALG